MLKQDGDTVQDGGRGSKFSLCWLWSCCFLTDLTHTHTFELPDERKSKQNMG